MALEPKQLVYQGTFGKEDNPLPKVKYEDIPKERRKKLHRKRLYNVVPEEFEEWLAVELDFNKYRYISEGIDFEHTKKRLADEEDQKSLAQYYRAEYNHMQKFAIWEEEHLTPLVKELTGMAKSNPQYDCHFLYKLGTPEVSLYGSLSFSFESSRCKWRVCRQKVVSSVYQFT